MRTHVVLVPGFGGFDAFGAMKYYAGVTGLFRAWRRPHLPTGWRPAHLEAVPWHAADRPRRAATVLHYFDNEPTAAVATRAAALERFLAKLVARGQIGPRDRVALVGHSTGGLDLRALVRNLAADPDRRLAVDGLEGADAPRAGALLRRIRRVVFLSVPQRGTNISDWLLAHPAVAVGIVGALRTGLATSSLTRGALPAWAIELLADQPRAGLVLAALDVLAATSSGQGDGLRAADARQERSDVALWLADADADFLALRDLRAGPPDEDEDEAKPAWRLLDDDVAAWPTHVETLSFATLGEVPFDAPELAVGPSELRPLTGVIQKATTEGRDGTDLFYRLAWWLCSAGPFPGVPSRTLVDATTGVTAVIRDGDNDGIVNTASMIWPGPGATRLVRGDHGDVLGHYTSLPVPPLPGPGRRHVAVDLLGSGSGFDETRLRRVWREVLDFCAR